MRGSARRRTTTRVDAPNRLYMQPKCTHAMRTCILAMHACTKGCPAAVCGEEFPHTNASDSQDTKRPETGGDVAHTTQAVRHGHSGCIHPWADLLRALGYSLRQPNHLRVR